MQSDLHPAVTLLLKRMESHPDEFKDQYMLTELKPTFSEGRWDTALRAIKDNGSEQDHEALNEALGAIRMNQIHEWVMDELCNGDDRRRKEREAREEEERRYTAHQQAYANQAIGTGTYNQYQNALSKSLQNTKEAIAAQALLNSQVPGLKYQPGIDAYEFHQQGFTTTYTREALEDNPGILAAIKKAVGL